MAEIVYMIALSPTMETGRIARWNKKEGDMVKNGDVICEVETDKATMEYESSQEGTLLKIIRGEGTESRVGDTIALMGKPGEDISALISGTAPGNIPSPAPEKTEEPEILSSASSALSHGSAKASPLARKMAGELGIDLSHIAGTGPEGRIVKRDIEMAKTAPAVSQKPVAGDRVIPHSPMRRTIARRLSRSMFTAPHFYLKLTVAMDEILKAREELNEKREHRVSLNAFLIKFLAIALDKHRTVNSTWGEDSITEHGSIDMGFAVEVPDGLITPVIKDCLNKGIIEIDRIFRELAEKAGKGLLQPEEYSGATFTLSNLGSYGIEEFTAVINPPGSAILAVGKITDTPVAGEDGELFFEKQMKMTLSCDHRVIDGATGAKFLKYLKDIMENPYKILF